MQSDAAVYGSNHCVHPLVALSCCICCFPFAAYGNHRRISADYKGKKLLVVGVLNGAFVFTAGAEAGKTWAVPIDLTSG
jgi:hypothetical protein